MFSCALTLSDAVCPWFLFLSFKPLDMAPKVGRKFKTKANRTSASSSAPSQVDRVRFLLAESEEIFETLTKFRSIWGERQVVLDELDPSITNESMCLPSLFIQTIVGIYRSKSKSQRLFFPVFIYRVLNFLGLEDLLALELVHIIAPIGATFLKQR